MQSSESTVPRPPLRLDELVTILKARPPKTRLTDAEIEHSLFLASDEKLKVVQSLKAVGEEGAGEAGVYELSLRVQGASIGRHVLPPKPMVREFRSEHDVRQRQRAYPYFNGYLPDHLGLSILPRLKSPLPLRSLMFRPIVDRLLGDDLVLVSLADGPSQLGVATGSQWSWVVNWRGIAWPRIDRQSGVYPD